MKAKINFTDKLIKTKVGDKLFIVENVKGGTKIKEAAEIIGIRSTVAGVGLKMKFADWVTDDDKKNIIEAVQDAIKKEKK